MTRKDIVLEGLKSRLRSIEFISDSLSNKAHSERNYTSFYQEISYYVHYIVNTDELKKIFFELLSYFNKLKENDKYLEAIQTVNNRINTISKDMLNHPDFDNFKTAYPHKFKNPLYFCHPIFSSNAEDILRRLEVLKFTSKKPLFF